MKKTTKKKQGYTIVEILIGVIVAAIVIAGIYVGWNAFYSSNQATTIAGDVTQIIQSTENVFSKSADQYTSLTDKVAIQNNIYPSSLRLDSETAHNSFGGVVTLTALEGNPGLFTLTYADIPSAVCQKILANIATANINEIAVAGTSIWKTGEIFPSVAKIQEACTKSNTIDMVFVAN